MTGDALRKYDAKRKEERITMGFLCGERLSLYHPIMSVFASFFITQHELASRIIAVLRYGKQDCQFCEAGSTIRHQRIRAWSPGVEVFHTGQYGQD